MGLMNNHGVLERHSLLLTIGILVVVSIGGIIQMAPLMYMDNTIEKVDGMRPYTPLELKGRDIYIREGCYVCHSQMVRPLRDEVERYGHYSLAAESMYDCPVIQPGVATTKSTSGAAAATSKAKTTRAVEHRPTR